MKRLIGGLALCAVTITGGAAIASTSTTGAQMTQVTLTSVGGNGIAEATFIDAGVAGTRLVIDVGRTPQGLTNPRVFADIGEGSCAAPPTNPAYEVSASVNRYMPGGGDAVTSNQRFGAYIPIRLETLRSHPHVISLYTGDAAGHQMIACGNIG